MSRLPARWRRIGPALRRRWHRAVCGLLGPDASTRGLARIGASIPRRWRPTAAAVIALVLAATTGSLIAVSLAGRPSAATWVPAEPTGSSQRPPLPKPQGRSRGAPPEASPPPGHFTSWALLDLRTGGITGSRNWDETSTTASMIKAWIAADFLRLTAKAGGKPSEARLEQLRLVIRDSDNEHAQRIFGELGAHESIERLIDICQLTDSYPVKWYWSNTRLSARDTARMGACLADGRAAGPAWTGWLLDEMRAVRGVGDFGIRHALPAEAAGQVAIKNGWVERSALGEYHVNCLAIGETWAMGVLTRYPAELGYQHGAEICEALARAHLPEAAGAASPAP